MNGNGKYLPNMFRGHGEAGQKGKCRLSEIRTPKISYGDFLTAANFAFLHPVMGDVNWELGGATKFVSKSQLFG